MSRSTGPTATARRVVQARARGRCERCAYDLSGGGGQVHHRQPRKMGGTSRASINDVRNLLFLCASCHAWVEHRRTAAYAAGYLVREPTDPAAVPVALAAGRVLLTGDGGYALAGSLHVR